MRGWNDRRCAYTRLRQMKTEREGVSSLKDSVKNFGSANDSAPIRTNMERRPCRPVGQILARNPVPTLVPCHRVIASNGNLGSYSGGSSLQAKRWLPRLEGAI